MYIKKTTYKIFSPLFLLFISLILFMTRDYSQAQDSTVGLSNIHKVGSILLVFFLMLYYFFKTNKIRKIPLAYKLYGGYIFIGMLSAVFFSQWLGYSIWKILEIITVYLTILYIWNLSKNTPQIIKYSYELTIKYYKFLILLTLVGIILFPSMAIRPPSQYQEAFLPYMFFGVIAQINSNSLGILSVIVFYISFVRLSNKRIINFKSYNFYWLLLSGVFIIFSQSRTALAALIVVLGLYILLTKKIAMIIKIFIILGIIMSIVYNMESILLYLGRGYEIEHLEKLSGRLMWWTAAWDTFMNSSFLEQTIGLGFGTANRVVLIGVGHGDAASLHSDYVDALISTGYLGLLFLVLSVVLTLLRILKLFKSYQIDSYIAEIIGVFLIIVIRSFSGTSIAFHNFFLIMFLISMLNIYFYKISIKNITR